MGQKRVVTRPDFCALKKAGLYFVVAALNGQEG